MSNYYDIRREASKMVPRSLPLFEAQQEARGIDEKGRKKGYQEFKIVDGDWFRSNRLLKVDEFGSFVEVSCRAAACPMPLNLDVYDGLRCPFGCKYCFADSFRSSLYTSFFDNARTVGLRHSDLDFCKCELDKLLKYRGKQSINIDGGGTSCRPKRVTRTAADGKEFHSRGEPTGWQMAAGSKLVALRRAVARELPMRLGIRFEDFVPRERKLGISLGLLNYLADQAYPTMINTKSDLVGENAYVEALGRNAGRAAVHMTLISSNNKLLKALEPGAPSYERRIWAMGQLVSAGVRVVARIEPFLVFLSDPEEEVERYMTDLAAVGVKNITFDTYSYTAKNPGIRQAFYDLGLDWDRLFLMGCDSQGLGSLLLGEFMQLWRQRGFSCSTFDMGNVPDNDQLVCCEVGDWFRGGYNYGCSVGAARYIKKRKGERVSWFDFASWVAQHDGFLCASLEDEVHHLWNLAGNDAYSHGWARGLEPVGQDAGGLIWTWDDTDFRRSLL